MLGSDVVVVTETSAPATTTRFIILQATLVRDKGLYFELLDVPPVL